MDIKILSSAGLDAAELYRTYGERKIGEAKAYAKDLKDRYTVLCMSYDLLGDGMDQDKSEQSLAKM